MNTRDKRITDPLLNLKKTKQNLDKIRIIQSPTRHKDLAVSMTWPYETWSDPIKGKDTPPLKNFVSLFVQRWKAEIRVA